MSHERKITPPPAAIEAQKRATNPQLSAWVAANAGSGKTYVLSRRVVRLMLAGTEPGAILCLTFTKAAAATMANRVFKMLAEWVALDDAALSDQLYELEGLRPDAARLATARRLFARALETPGGLKVQTIHAFCERVLHQFPFEANVPSHFTVLDDRMRAEMVEKAKTALLLQAANNEQGAEAQALALLMPRMADGKLAELLDDAVSVLRKGSIASVAATRAHLPAALGLAEGDTLEKLERAEVEEALIAASEWVAVADHVAHLSDAPTDRDFAAALKKAATAPLHERHAYRSAFLTQQGTVRKTIVTAAIRKKEAALAQKFSDEALRLEALQQKIRAARLISGTSAILTLAAAIHRSIEALKARSGALDFDDLISKTRSLFTRIDAAWVLFKLDQGIDHILVDEAQDTSPEQWELVRALVDEFTAGHSARAELKRTLFVVGDEKQSIYSFQGADPAAFDTMRRHFEQGFLRAEQRFERIPMSFSFRSTPMVLKAVDQVFATDEARRGISADDAAPVHSAARSDAPGLVELWPLTAGDEKPAEQPWTAPVDSAPPGNAESRLAMRLARTIRHWLRNGETLPDKTRPVRPGDILILVRRRSLLFSAIIRALKSQGIAVAGADRMILGEHIAVIDLMALGDCLLTPDDDLTLAALLKSPLFGLSEDALFMLAHSRKGSLWQAVAEARPDIAATLERWRKEALMLSPARFYAAVLARDKGRAKMLARFGAEANDAIDEFLALALGYEQQDVPSLAGFLADMRAAKTEVKRDMDLERDEVRVMTVHGSKGLEADIVFLADTMSEPSASHDPRLFTLTSPHAPAPLIVWSPSASADAGPVEKAREKTRDLALQEYRRLLYVAMTRAADRLIITGIQKERAPKRPWYDLIAEALRGKGAEVPADDGEGTIWRWGEAAHKVERSENTQAQQPQLPDWVNTAAPKPTAPQRPLLPSRSEENAPDMPVRLRLEAADDEARRFAIRRGILIHRLLQSLPGLQNAEHEAAMHRFLARQTLSEAQRHDIAAHVLRLLHHDMMKALFSHEARVEVSVAGMVAGQPVAGQIDRLMITEQEVIIADYKTGRPVPQSADEVAPVYVTQMALYRALLRQIFPQKTVRCLLVFTDTPLLIPLPEARMDEALQALISGAG